MNIIADVKSAPHRKALSRRLALPLAALALGMPMTAHAVNTKVSGSIKINIAAIVVSATQTALGTVLQGTCSVSATSSETGQTEIISVNTTISSGKVNCSPYLPYSFYVKSAASTLTINYNIELFGSTGSRSAIETMETIPLPANGAATVLSAGPQL